MNHSVAASGRSDGEKKSAMVFRLFSRITPKYDRLNLLMSFGLDRLWRQKCISLLGLYAGDRAVDLCCGTGDLTRLLGERLGSSNVLGLDFVPGMIDIAREKYPHLEFREGDALNTGIASSSFDGATVAFALRNVDDVGQLFAEMARIVRPGGRVLSLELTRPEGLLGLLHRLFIFTVVPVLGWLVSGDYKAYRYLASSIAKFPPPAEVAELMRAQGLSNVRVYRLHGGIATIHLGTKVSR